MTALDYTVSAAALCYLVDMSLSRRQFFRRFLGSTEKASPERLARYEIMENYVRTHLLPYDFSISSDQESELFADVRAVLESASNTELFSIAIRARIEEAVEARIQPWREESRLRYQADRVKEIRESAPDYVTTFLTLQATPQAVEQLKTRFLIEDSKALEVELRERIRDWVMNLDDDQLMQYDVFTIKDLVFAQLRSWC